MTVAIVGGGLQGCLVALELAQARVATVVFEARNELVDAASRWNEGKIHLGYIYANDSSLRTARRMIDGSTLFARLLERALGERIPAESISEGFVYALHRDSMISGDDIAAHLRAVDLLVEEALVDSDRNYLGERRLAPVAEIDPSEAGLSGSTIVRAWRTDERSIDPQWVARTLDRRIRATPLVELALNRRVDRFVRRADGRLSVHDAAGEWHGPFDAVVNAAWESRLALDATLGHYPAAPWSHRYKLAMHATAADTAPDLASVTAMLGPFGDIVNFGAGRLYLSWYPVGRVATATTVEPTAEPTFDQAGRERIARAIIEGLATIAPDVAGLLPMAGSFALQGGYIFAWGDTDIVDPASELHNRHDIGVHTDRRYHSIDTGKYGMAPLNATIAAARIAPDVVPAQAATSRQDGST